MTLPSPTVPALRRAGYAAAGLVCLGLPYAALAQSDETPLDVVATAVRQNGFACQSPESVTPDPDATSPDEKAWIIRCDGAAYRVKFLGDEGAEVTPLGE